MASAMNTKRIKKIACLSVLLSFCAFLLWIVIVNVALYIGSGDARVSLTPSKWGFSLAEEWYSMDERGQKTGTSYKTKLGPVLVEIYRPVIHKVPLVR